MKVVSFSLWGDSPIYLEGARRNAVLVQEQYPGWTARFYVHEGVPGHLIAALTESGAQVRMVAGPSDWTGLLWRYFAIDDPAVTVAVFRDCDSRLSAREAAAVQEWLTEDQTLHVMRDHPAHTMPIMGGLWGVRCDRARWIGAEVRGVGRGGGYYQMDQLLLAREVWPRLSHDCLVHDEFHGWRPFPRPREGDDFVGQVYDERDHSCERHARTLRAALRQ